MGWIEDFATALGDAPLTAEEGSLLLDAARDVAHTVERKITPLSTFLMGAAVERARADGLSRAEALSEIMRSLHETLPSAE
jgi:hypothetical protein